MRNIVLNFLLCFFAFFCLSARIPVAAGDGALTTPFLAEIKALA